MEITVEQIKKIEDFVKAKLDSLNFKHTQDVVRLAEKIGKAEKADLTIIKAGALLHDVGKSIADKNHALHSADLARKFLEHENFNQRFVEEAVYCVLCHQYAWDGQTELLNTIEAKVVADADLLCAMTPLGLVKVFILFQQELYKDYGQSVSDIRDILLNIKKLLTTKTGKFLYREYLTEASAFIQKLT